MYSSRSKRFLLYSYFLFFEYTDVHDLSSRPAHEHEYRNYIVCIINTLLNQWTNLIYFHPTYVKSDCCFSCTIHGPTARRHQRVLTYNVVINSK